MKRMMITMGLALSLVMGGTVHKAQADTGTLGTVIGAVGGGLLGSTFGKGRGKTVATAAGAVIGAVIGHEVATADTRYERPRSQKVVVYKEPRKKLKKWKRVARYGDDVLVCNKNGKRCHWYD